MSLSLRDQLLQAGLVTEKQVQDAERQGQRKHYQGHKQQNRTQRAAPSQKDLEVQKAREAKAARDAELNRRQQEKLRQKEVHAQIRELVQQNKVTRPDVEDSFSFVYKGKVSRVRADAALRARITSGDLAIVRCDGRFELVPPAIAEKIKERDPRALVDLNASSSAATATVDEAYKDFVVPDDLMW